ncbi:MAG TPA: 2-dehydro-3-deoxygluconokinase [Firmicutes bacterium]|nr:2-dehydro-3-deoxygluconokinase [Bacillota bacterium]
MAKIVTFGEIMLRLSSPSYSRLIQSQQFDVHYGGGEANVAVSLANYGHQAYFVSKLPSNPLGDAAINSLRKYGVDTSYISRGGERVGIYYLETGASMRASNVIYDRKYSSIYGASVEDFDFDEIFKGKDWFHFTGITPALNDDVAHLVELACIAAKKAGCTISCDLNFRKKLWTSEKAISVMSKLMKYVDVCIGNDEDADKCLGFKPESTDVNKGTLNIGGYESIFKQMKEKFGFKYIATSLRESISASDNNWSGLIYDGTNFHLSKKYSVRIVDRVGAGDSFAAGVIHGLLEYKDAAKAVEFAVAASALKHTIPGDFNHVSKVEVETLMNGDGSGRVQR